MASVSLRRFCTECPRSARQGDRCRRYRQRELWRLPVELIGVGETALCRGAGCRGDRSDRQRRRWRGCRARSGGRLKLLSQRRVVLSQAFDRGLQFPTVGVSGQRLGYRIAQRARVLDGRRSFSPPTAN